MDPVNGKPADSKPTSAELADDHGGGAAVAERKTGRAAPSDAVAETRAKLPAAPKSTVDASKIVGAMTTVGPYVPELDAEEGTQDPPDRDGDHHETSARGDGDPSGEETSSSAAAARNDVEDERTGERRGKKPEAIDEELLERAEAAGMSRGRAKKFGTAEALEEALALLDEQRETAHREEPQRRDESAAREDATTREETDGTQSQPGGFKKFEWDREQFNEVANEVIEKLVGHFEPQIEAALQENAALKERLEQGEQRALRREAATVTQQIDDVIREQFPEELKDVYGTLPTHKLPANSKALQQRAQLRQVMAAIQRAREEAGLELHPIDKLVQKAVAELHEDVVLKQLEKKAEAKITTERRTREGQTLMRPAGRQTSAPSGLDPKGKMYAVADREWNRIFGRKGE